MFSSAYLKNTNGLIENAIAEEKATTLLRRARVTMPKTSAQARSGYIVSVRDAGSPVKPKLKNVTESAQFKRWFGNWVENPEKASKL